MSTPFLSPLFPVKRDQVPVLQSGIDLEECRPSDIPHPRHIRNQAYQGGAEGDVESRVAMEYDMGAA